MSAPASQALVAFVFGMKNGAAQKLSDRDLSAVADALVTEASNGVRLESSIKLLMAAASKYDKLGIQASAELTRVINALGPRLADLRARIARSKQAAAIAVGNLGASVAPTTKVASNTVRPWQVRAR